ncbi:MAG: FtsH protease activity modulator HflK [SAR324 cluster bacterium]|nr:FtsH protease activity modulator HflK [SAR324 cluster bacterium]
MDWKKPPPKSPWGKKPPQPNVDEILNSIQNQLKHGFQQRNFNWIIIVVGFLIWASTGFFIVEPPEQAVVKRFGVFNRIEEPGPHLALPVPFETVEKANVKEVRRLEIGFRTIEPGPPARYRRVSKEALMLTGDENIVDVQFIVQYKIIDLPDYLFNITDPLDTVRAASESAMREVIGRTHVDDAITIGKGAIEASMASLLQGLLNSYSAGIKIENVKLQDVHPPDPVKEAFKDVASAKEDREKMINDAYGYQNNLIPKARGEALQMINDAEAYAEKTVLVAQGKASRFDSIYAKYKDAKEITKDRIRIETMEIILPKVNKVIADPQLGKNFLPFLPIRELTDQNQSK